MKGLKNVLLAMAVYMTVIGVLFLFAPSVAKAAFQLSLPDAALNMLYGQVVLGIALMAYLVSTDVAKYARLVWALIFVEAGHILVFGWQLMTGLATFAQVGPPMIIAVIFLVLIFYFKRNVRS
jgi:uncharacterized protein YjeT (DUF2065 family)